MIIIVIMANDMLTNNRIIGYKCFTNTLLVYMFYCSKDIPLRSAVSPIHNQPQPMISQRVIFFGFSNSNTVETFIDL